MGKRAFHRASSTMKANSTKQSQKQEAVQQKQKLPILPSPDRIQFPVGTKIEKRFMNLIGDEEWYAGKLVGHKWLVLSSSANSSQSQKITSDLLVNTDDGDDAFDEDYQNVITSLRYQNENYWVVLLNCIEYDDGDCEELYDNEITNTEKVRVIFHVQAKSKSPPRSLPTVKTIGANGKDSQITVQSNNSKTHSGSPKKVTVQEKIVSPAQQKVASPANVKTPIQAPAIITTYPNSPFNNTIYTPAIANYFVTNENAFNRTHYNNNNGYYNYYNNSPMNGSHFYHGVTSQMPASFPSPPVYTGTTLQVARNSLPMPTHPSKRQKTMQQEQQQHHFNQQLQQQQQVRHHQHQLLKQQQFNQQLQQRQLFHQQLQHHYHHHPQLQLQQQQQLRPTQLQEHHHMQNQQQEKQLQTDQVQQERQKQMQQQKACQLQQEQQQQQQLLPNQLQEHHHVQNQQQEKQLQTDQVRQEQHMQQQKACQLQQEQQQQQQFRSNQLQEHHCMQNQQQEKQLQTDQVQQERQKQIQRQKACQLQQEQLQKQEKQQKATERLSTSTANPNNSFLPNKTAVHCSNNSVVNKNEGNISEAPAPGMLSTSNQNTNTSLPAVNGRTQNGNSNGVSTAPIKGPSATAVTTYGNYYHNLRSQYSIANFIRMSSNRGSKSFADESKNAQEQEGQLQQEKQKQLNEKELQQQFEPPPTRMNGKTAAPQHSSSTSSTELSTQQRQKQQQALPRQEQQQQQQTLTTGENSESLDQPKPRQQQLLPGHETKLSVSASSTENAAVTGSVNTNKESPLPLQSVQQESFTRKQYENTETRSGGFVRQEQQRVKTIPNRTTDTATVTVDYGKYCNLSTSRNQPPPQKIVGAPQLNQDRRQYQSPSRQESERAHTSKLTAAYHEAIGGDSQDHSTMGIHVPASQELAGEQQHFRQQKQTPAPQQTPNRKPNMTTPANSPPKQYYSQQSSQQQPQPPETPQTMGSVDGMNMELETPELPPSPSQENQDEPLPAWPQQQGQEEKSKTWSEQQEQEEKRLRQEFLSLLDC